MAEEMSDAQMPAGWDAQRAEELVGCVAVVTIYCMTEDGVLLHSQSAVGTVQAVDPHRGIELLRHRDGDVLTLPPTLGAFEPAAAGTYTLCQSGEAVEAVEDPDFTADFFVPAPSPH